MLATPKPRRQLPQRHLLTHVIRLEPVRHSRRTLRVGPRPCNYTDSRWNESQSLPKIVLRESRMNLNTRIM